MVTTSAVIALWVVPLLAYPVVLARFLFSVKPPRAGRAPILEAAIGATLFIGTVIILVTVAALRTGLDTTGNGPSGFGILALLIGMVGMLSLVLLLKGVLQKLLRSNLRIP